MLPRPADLPCEPTLSAAGLGLVVRFGSRARGTSRPDSDLDLAVQRADGRRLTHRELGELALVLGERYGLPVDLVDLRVADGLLRREVIREGVVLHADSRAVWVELVTRTLIDLDDLGPHLQACLDGVARAARGQAS